MEYFSVIQMNEIMLFVTMWMDLESIMLSEISKIETNTVTHHLSVESKKTSNVHGKAETDPQM